MANFNNIISKTLTFEGGFQKSSSDVANFTSTKKLVGTNRGISAIAYETYLGREPSEADMRAITPEIARAVYKKLFWDKMQGDKIASDSIAWIVFDTYIASGNLIRPRKYINKYYNEPKVLESNKSFNDAVVTLVNNANPKDLFNIIKEGEIQQRKDRAAKNPSQKKFLQGWLNRLNKIVYSEAAQIAITVLAGIFLIAISIILILKM
jgi:lysozyme family protein